MKKKTQSQGHLPWACVFHSCPDLAGVGGNQASDWRAGRGHCTGSPEGDLSPGLCFATCQACARRKALAASEPRIPPLQSKLFWGPNGIPVCESWKTHTYDANGSWAGAFIVHLLRSLEPDFPPAITESRALEGCPGPSQLTTHFTFTPVFLLVCFLFRLLECFSI